VITLSGEERSLLRNFLEQKLREKRGEEHRTESFGFREYVQHEEELLQVTLSPQPPPLVGEGLG